MSVSVFAVDSPVIVSQPQNVYLPHDVSFPVSVSFSVLASGSNLSYQWQTRDNSTADWRNAQTSSATSANFTSPIYESGANGVRQFRVIVTNSEGSVTSDTVSVSVGAYILDSIPQMLSWVTEIIGSIFAYVSQACSCIITTPLLLIGISFFALGGSIAIISRLLSRS